MDNSALADAEQHYYETLAATLRRYEEGLPYGRQRPRACGHVAWDVVRELPCLACAGDDLDRHAWRALAFRPPSALEGLGNPGREQRAATEEEQRD